jgi:hypothetical protein
MELNPNHPVTQAVSQQWHTIAAVTMRKLDVTEVVITEADLKELSSNPLAIAIQELPDGLHVKLIDMDAAIKLAAKEGGLPS